MISIIFTTFLNANQENVTQENPTLKSITQENPTLKNTINIIHEKTTLDEAAANNIIENDTKVKDKILKNEILPNTYNPNDILVGFYGKQAQLVAQDLIDNEMVDFVGTDIHNPLQLQALEACLQNEYLERLLNFEGLKNNTL